MKINCRCCRKGGSPDHENEGERERDKSAFRGLHKKNNSPKPLTGKWEGLIVARFYKQQSSRSKVLEAQTIAGVEPGELTVAPVKKEGRGPGADTMLWGSPGSHWERQFPFLGCIWERYHCLSRDKRAIRQHWAANTCYYLKCLSYLYSQLWVDTLL